MRLEETKMYKELISRSTENSRKYSGFLMPLQHDMDMLLQYIKQQYPEYPDHGLQHSLRIIEYIGKIISNDQIIKITDLEIFIFILAALFHDTGMTLYNSAEKEKIRAKHHCYAEKVITIYFDECFKNMSDRERIKEAVIFVCYAHGLLLSELTSDRRFNRVDTISYDDVRYSLLAFLLRIGDLMDLEGERANNFRMMMYSDEFSELAYDHNRRHQKVKVYNYSPSKIYIEVEAENIQQYKIWNEWFVYLKEDIFRANSYLIDTKISFPLSETKIVTNEGDEFDIQELRFEIDEKGGIWEIISKSIYTNELDFVRELVQNAIDATLKKIYVNEEIEINNASPRFWSINFKEEHILVGYSEKKHKLYIIDHGIGMSKEDLKNFLFKVSSSGRVERRNRKFDFPAIAQYGIGFVSCLINAEKIQVYTCKKNSDTIHHVTMESSLNVAFIQNIANKNGFAGTVIELELKHCFLNKDILDYMKRTFLYTSIEIRFLNIDTFERVVESLRDKSKYDAVLEKPYLLSDSILKVSQQLKVLRDPYMIERKKIDSYQEQIMELKDMFQEEYYMFYQKSKLSKYNLQVKYLKESAPFEEIKKNFPNIILSEYKEDTAEENFIKVIDDINEFDYKIIAEKAKYDNKIQNLSLNMSIISSQNISIGREWRYLVVFFDNEFNVYDIKYSLNPIELSGKTGIIFLKYCGQDTTLGIEFVAVSGFLFQNGKIFNRLARVSGYSERSNRFRNPKSFVIGIDSYHDDIREEVQDYFYGGYYGEDEPEDYFDDIYAGSKDIDAEYDVICISENNFTRLNNQNVFRVSKLYDDYYDETVDLYDELLRMNKMGAEDNISEGLVELGVYITKENNAYYQDGIAIPSRLNNLFPIGFFRIICNCTADARMKLNVTRHELSEIRPDLEAWMNNIGEKIQESILDSLINMLETEELYVEFEELINRGGDENYFSMLASERIRKVLRKKKLK